MAHPTSLKRAFRNVVDNAIKYGTSAHIGLSVEPDALVVNVDDEGPGIPIDRKEDAFAPFRRLDPARGQNVPGAGLGLTIARDVVQSHGGTIDLLNRDGGGLSVRISLPRR
jgi:signal transduction histidine kinase